MQKPIRGSQQAKPTAVRTEKRANFPCCRRPSPLCWWALSRASVGAYTAASTLEQIHIQNSSKWGSRGQRQFKVIRKPLRSSEFPNRAVYADQQTRKETCWYALQNPLSNEWRQGIGSVIYWMMCKILGRRNCSHLSIPPPDALSHLLPSLKILQSLCSLLRKIPQVKRRYILAPQCHKEQLLLSSVLLSFKAKFLYPLVFCSCVHTVYSWITNVLRQETVLSTTL